MKSSMLMPTLAASGWDQHLHLMLNQTTPLDEYIVIVDRQTSDAEMEKFREQWPSVTFLFNQKNIGIAASLNKGLVHASGDIVFRADDDDMYRCDRVEKQLECLDNTGADIIGSWAKGIFGTTMQASYLIKNPTDHDAIAKQLKRRNIMIHPSLAFRKAAILKLGGYDETFAYAQDYALYLRALRSGLKFANVPAPLIKRNYSCPSITTQYRYQQLMFSCAARIVDSAHAGNRLAFFQTLLQYAFLAAIPVWVRRIRKQVFKKIGRGV